MTRAAWVAVWGRVRQRDGTEFAPCVYAGGTAITAGGCRPTYHPLELRAYLLDQAAQARRMLDLAVARERVLAARAQPVGVLP